MRYLRYNRTKYKEEQQFKQFDVFCVEREIDFTEIQLEHSRYNSLFSVHFDLVRAPDAKEQKKNGLISTLS